MDNRDKVICALNLYFVSNYLNSKISLPHTRLIPYLPPETQINMLSTLFLTVTGISGKHVNSDQEQAD